MQDEDNEPVYRARAAASKPGDVPFNEQTYRSAISTDIARHLKFGEAIGFKIARPESINNIVSRVESLKDHVVQSVTDRERAVTIADYLKAVKSPLGEKELVEKVLVSVLQQARKISADNMNYEGIVVEENLVDHANKAISKLLGAPEIPGTYTRADVLVACGRCDAERKKEKKKEIKKILKDEKKERKKELEEELMGDEWKAHKAGTSKSSGSSFLSSRTSASLAEPRRTNFHDNDAVAVQGKHDRVKMRMTKVPEHTIPAKTSDDLKKRSVSDMPPLQKIAKASAPSSMPALQKISNRESKGITSPQQPQQVMPKLQKRDPVASKAPESVRSSSFLHQTSPSSSPRSLEAKGKSSDWLGIPDSSDTVKARSPRVSGKQRSSGNFEKPLSDFDLPPELSRGPVEEKASTFFSPGLKKVENTEFARIASRSKREKFEALSKKNAPSSENSAVKFPFQSDCLKEFNGLIAKHPEVDTIFLPSENELRLLSEKAQKAGSKIKYEVLFQLHAATKRGYEYRFVNGYIGKAVGASRDTMESIHHELGIKSSVTSSTRVTLGNKVVTVHIHSNLFIQRPNN